MIFLVLKILSLMPSRLYTYFSAAYAIANNPTATPAQTNTNVALSAILCNNPLPIFSSIPKHIASVHNFVGKSSRAIEQGNFSLFAAPPACCFSNIIPHAGVRIKKPRNICLGGNKAEQTIIHTATPRVILSFLLSSRLYCRFWNCTKSAVTTSCQPLPPLI